MPYSAYTRGGKAFLLRKAVALGGLLVGADAHIDGYEHGRSFGGFGGFRRGNSSTVAGFAHVLAI